MSLTSGSIGFGSVVLPVVVSRWRAWLPVAVLLCVPPGPGASSPRGGRVSIGDASRRVTGMPLTSSPIGFASFRPTLPSVAVVSRWWARLPLAALLSVPPGPGASSARGRRVSVEDALRRATGMSSTSGLIGFELFASASLASVVVAFVEAGLSRWLARLPSYWFPRPLDLERCHD
jgi:hypothetical protein